MTIYEFNTISPRNNPDIWHGIHSLAHTSRNGTEFSDECNLINLSKYTPPDVMWQTCTDDNEGMRYPDENELTLWLIALFTDLFVDHNVTLVHAVDKGVNEPEYFPATDTQPAMICFAHGYYASALHEISHWCIAGKHRRTLNDFGYWYEADGRSEEQQANFEKVEIKPQAIECLLTLACQREFSVSQDNLCADFDTSQSTFKQDVYEQALAYLANSDTMPRDARRLLTVFYAIFQI